MLNRYANVRVLARNFNMIFAAIAMSAISLPNFASSLQVYRVPQGGVTDGIDLLGMSDMYYTDRLQGRGGCAILGEVTHSPVSLESPFLLMGAQGNATSFAPSTTLDSIPIRIVEGGAWKYVKENGDLAVYQSGSGYGQLDIEKGSFQAYALRLSGNDAARSHLYVTNGSSLTLTTTLFVGTDQKNGTFVLDNGNFIAYTAVEMGQFRGGETVSTCTSVNTAIVANATLNLNTPGSDGGFHMGKNSASDGVDTTTDRNVLILENGGVLYAKKVSRYNDSRGRIIFRGGKYTYFTRGDSNSSCAFTGGGNGTLELEGDAHPIHIDTGANTVDFCWEWTPNIVLTGNGGFKKSGEGKLVFNKPYFSSRLRSSFSGGVFVDGGILTVSGRDNMFPATNMLFVAEGASFDMNGVHSGFSGVTGSGSVVNTSAASSTLTLGYGNGTYQFSTALGNNISLVKTDVSTLVVSGDAAGNTCDLDIKEGMVVFSSDSSSYGTVTVRSGATLDISKCNFSCVELVREQGSTIKRKPGLSIVVK